MFVEEGHVVFQHRAAHIPAQVQDHVSHHLGGHHLADVVEAPGEHTQQQHAQGQHQQVPGGRVLHHQIQSPGDQDGTAGSGCGVEGEHPRGQQHLSAGGAEVSADAPDQLGVPVVAVVVFGIQSVKQEGHWYLFPRSGRRSADIRDCAPEAPRACPDRSACLYPEPGCGPPSGSGSNGG